MKAIRIDEEERYPDGRVGFRFATGEAGTLEARGKKVIVFGSQAELDAMIADELNLPDQVLLIRHLARHRADRTRAVGVEVKSVEDAPERIVR